MGKRKHRHQHGKQAQTNNRIECHESPKYVMRIGSAMIWAGKARELEDRDWALRLQMDTSAWSREGGGVTLNAAARKIIPAGQLELDEVPMVDIKWPDYDIPKMGKPWWENLVGILKGLKGNVGVYCMGGHGRTGTCLSILAALSGACGKHDPVLWVRKVYCEKAVESDRQLEYFEKMTGQLTTAKPSENWGHWTKGGGHFHGTGNTSIGRTPTGESIFRDAQNGLLYAWMRNAGGVYTKQYVDKFGTPFDPDTKDWLSQSETTGTTETNTVQVDDTRPYGSQSQLALPAPEPKPTSVPSVQGEAMRRASSGGATT